MPSRQDQKQTRPSTSKQADGDPGTRSGQPNPEDVPSRSTEHKSGYGGELDSPRTSSDQAKTQKGS